MKSNMAVQICIVTNSYNLIENVTFYKALTLNAKFIVTLNLSEFQLAINVHGLHNVCMSLQAQRRTFH